MYWKVKPLTYDILIPPLKKPFEKFSKTEAKEYFDWYIGKIPERIDYLRAYSGLNLDLSPESLVTIWAWFLKNAEVEKTPRIRIDELKRQTKDLPPDIRRTVIRENSRQLSLQTEYMVRDITMYFGEVCVVNNEAIHWGYHTDIKKDSFANRPILQGFLDRDFSPPFKAGFDPGFMVRGGAFSLLHGETSENELKILYDKWQRMA